MNFVVIYFFERQLMYFLFVGIFRDFGDDGFGIIKYKNDIQKEDIYGLKLDMVKY